MNREDNTHFCDRCKQNTPLKEWTYIPKFHLWHHDLCGWREHIPNKIRGI